MRKVREAVTGQCTMAGDQHRADIRAALAVHGVEPSKRLGPRLDGSVGVANRRAVRAAVHHPARLRTWLLLCFAKGQPLGGRLSRPDNVVSLRLLEEHSCGPSRY